MSNQDEIDRIQGLLQQVWTNLIKEFREYPKGLWMFWHENDLHLHLGHRLIVKLSKKDGKFDVHANVKIDPTYFREGLKNALEKALPKIQKFRGRGNYVDLVVNRHQDVSSPFLLCAELKYWYYERDPDDLREQVGKDLERLAVLKREGVSEQIACLILNAIYDPKETWICELNGKLKNYERELGLSQCLTTIL